MSRTAWCTIVVLLGSAMLAGCGGRSMLLDPPTKAPAADATVAAAPDAFGTVGCAETERTPAPCPSSQWFAFEGDTRCRCLSSVEPGCSSTVKHVCTSWGDGRCYRLCQSNADCTDPCFPFCRVLGLYAGSDQCGPAAQSVCLREDRDTCDPSAERL